MAVIWLPKAGPLFIDMLSMTLDIPENQQQAVVKDFKEYLPDNIGRKKIYSSIHYHLNIKLYYENSGQILLQCGPKFSNGNFFRIEWNPSNGSTEDVADITNLIIPDGYTGLIKYGRITRIDIATDVANLNMKGFLFRYPGITIAYNYLKKDGILTAYLGSKGSENLFRFYDKTQQIKDSNATKPKLYKESLPKSPTTRIEWQFRPKEICTFAKLNDTCKPLYRKLSCSMVANLPLKPTNDLEGHINSVIGRSRYEGFQSALYGIPKYRRVEVLNFIRQNTHTSWWNPEGLWKTFPDAIEPIVNHKQNKWAINE